MLVDGIIYDLVVFMLVNVLIVVVIGLGSGDVQMWLYVYIWVILFGEEFVLCFVMVVVMWQLGKIVIFLGFEVIFGG